MPIDQDTLAKHRKRASIASKLEGVKPSTITELRPSEAFRVLSAKERPTELVDFPRFDEAGKPLFQFRFQILTQYEIDSASAAAEEYTRRRLKDKRFTQQDIAEMREESWREVYDNARLVELLFIAMRDDSDIKQSLFSHPDELRKLLTADELAQLFHSYTAVQFKFGPLWRMLDENEIDELVDHLTAGVGASPLAGLAHGQLIQLVLSMASRLSSLRIDTGSAGSPSESGSTDISQKTADIPSEVPPED